MYLKRECILLDSLVGKRFETEKALQNAIESLGFNVSRLEDKTSEDNIDLDYEFVFESKEMFNDVEQEAIYGYGTIYYLKMRDNGIYVTETCFEDN